MSYEKIMNKFVEKEQEILKLKDEIHRLRAELDRLKRLASDRQESVK